MVYQRALGVTTAAWLLVLLIAAAAVNAQAQPVPEQTLDEPEGMESLPPSLRYLLVQRLLDARLAGDQTRPVRKRTCLINAGLSHGCDYKDLMGAMEESNYWNSALSPGRRRRSVFPQGKILSERSQEIENPVANSNEGEITTDRRVVKIKKNEMHKALNRIPRSLSAF